MVPRTRRTTAGRRCAGCSVPARAIKVGPVRGQAGRAGPGGAAVGGLTHFGHRKNRLIPAPKHAPASRAGASDVPVQGFVALTTRCDHFQPMILFIAPPCVDSGGGGHLHQDRGASLPARPLTTPKGDSCQDHVHQRGCAFCRVFCAI